MRINRHIENPDLVLIGSGIMSATLGALMKRLAPSLKIQVYEVTEKLAQESSNGWNNAGTGHAGMCELSYTPFREPDGTVKIGKAIEIFEQFERSLQFWAYAVSHGMAGEPAGFVNAVPHISFVQGEEQVDFLRARHAGLAAHHFFRGMKLSVDPLRIAKWAPLLVEGRAPGVPIAATKMDDGTDVNFGEIARRLLAWLSEQDGGGVASHHRVIGLAESRDGWDVSVRDLTTGELHRTHAGFVFVGAGGGSLPLLQQSGITESKGLGGFPIGGQWLVCDRPEIVERHPAKVYGQALGAAPTMAVPHLDHRIIEGRRALLFGPFAAWTTKFLHRKGSFTDLPFSIRPHNLATLLKVAVNNLDLVRYLIGQGTQSMADRMKVLHAFYPEARAEDWRLVDAGIRVQAIKKTDGEAGIVHYGTEVITNERRTLAALLGASPGASVSTHIMLEVIQQCFPALIASAAGSARLKEMIPSIDVDIKLPANADFFRTIHEQALRTLRLIA